MAYKIEVTADSLSELAGKILAVAAQFQAAVPPASTLAQIEADEKPKPRKAKPVEVADAAPADPTPAPKSAPAAEATESPQTTEEPASSPADAPKLNYERDVAALVLRTLSLKGKDVVAGILSSFGVVKASHLAEDRWPELIAALKDA